MGWHIKLVENTVKITPEIASDLYLTGAMEELFGYDIDEDEIFNDGEMLFLDDHMEHMDYMWDERIQEVLKNNNVKGIISFSSNEGDNKGTAWGYKFDGKGGMTEISGKLKVEWKK